MADYVFVETSDRGPRGLRYEVRCRKCGECYSEDSRAVPNLPALVEQTLHWPPDCEAVPPRDWRKEILDRWEAASDRGRSEVDALNRQLQGAYELTKAWVEERRTARALNQTGGYVGGG